MMWTPTPALFPPIGEGAGGKGKSITRLKKEISDMKVRIKWLRGNFFPVRLWREGKSDMKVRITRPVAASLLAGLLCWLPASNQQAQIASAATGFAGQAAAVSGFAGGGVVSVADTGALAASGDAIGAAALETTFAGGLAV